MLLIVGKSMITIINGKVIFSISTHFTGKCLKNHLLRVESKNLRFYLCIIGYKTWSEMRIIIGKSI
jgi:hypothetical protein